MSEEERLRGVRGNCGVDIKKKINRSMDQSIDISGQSEEPISSWKCPSLPCLFSLLSLAPALTQVLPPSPPQPSENGSAFSPVWLKSAVKNSLQLGASLPHYTVSVLHAASSTVSTGQLPLVRCPEC